MTGGTNMGSAAARMVMLLFVLAAAAPEAWAQAPARTGSAQARRRPPRAEQYTTPAHCRGGIVNRGKLHRCLSCVGRGGTFHRQGRRPGVCVERDQTLLRAIRRARGCALHVDDPALRRSCVRCTRQGGLYNLLSGGDSACSSWHKPAAALAPEHALMDSRGTRHARLATRPRHERGGSTPPSLRPATERAPPLRAKTLDSGPLPTHPLTDLAGCDLWFKRIPLRRPCQRCVQQGHWYHPDWRLCAPPSDWTPIVSAAECPLRLDRRPLRARCRACLRAGGKYFPAGRCSLAPKRPAGRGSPEELELQLELGIGGERDRRREGQGKERRRRRDRAPEF